MSGGGNVIAVAAVETIVHDTLYVFVHMPSVDASPDKTANEGTIINFRGIFTEPGWGEPPVSATWIDRRVSRSILSFLRLSLLELA